jgi:NADPH-dependent 2,4-dienoyl-CoA reductase/sulfur reductase-like enzyme
MESVKCLVVGAGVIGVAVARARARAGRKVIVVESESRIGAGADGEPGDCGLAGAPRLTTLRLDPYGGVARS